MRRPVACPIASALALAALLLLAPQRAEAHGIFGHIHVTGWAIENLPDGELRTFFDDPEVRNAALFGAAFTDSGYWPRDPDIEAQARAYGEHTHWEPFIEDFVVWIMVHDPPPWDSLESRKRVAFLMGCAAHGLQDEIFDSLFLDQVGVHDGGGQDEADPATDGFLALDGHLRFFPAEYVPMDVLVELYAGLDAGVTPEVIDSAVTAMTFAYVNDELGPAIATSLGEMHEAQLDWTRLHYLDMEVPGSLRSEILPTAAYLQALWERLHGRAPASATDLVTWTFPAPPRRLASALPGSPDSRVTLIFGAGVRFGSVAPAWHAELDGAAVPFALRNTRWNETWTRLVRLEPDAALAPGAFYAVGLADGLEPIGAPQPIAAGDWTLRFQVACDESDPAPCPDLGELEVPDIEPPPEPEPEPEPDAPPEPLDTAEADDASDTAAPGDATGPGDDALEAADTAAPPLDTAAGEDTLAPPSDGGSDDGCGCRTAARDGHAPIPTGLTTALLLALGLIGARRRRARR